MISKNKIKQLLLILITILFVSGFAQGETVVPDCGGGDAGGGSSLSGDRIQDEANTLSWAAGSPPSVSANSSGTAAVVGGHPPYIWNIGGSDYSFSASSQVNSETTQGNSITIHGNNFNNCNPPSAIITVTASIEGGVDLIEGTISPPAILFDYDNAPPSVDGDAQITPGSSSATVYVTGGVPPYTWAVSPNTGTNYFTLAHTGPGNSNTVYLHGNPCLAEITITDDCGNSATGYVRGPGQWGASTDGCLIEGVGTGRPRILIRGKFKQTHGYHHNTSMRWGRCPTDRCNSYCATSGDCHPEFGCNDCLYKDGNIIPCGNSGYINTPCPPSCRNWCNCTTELYYQEWECVP